MSGYQTLILSGKFIIFPPLKVLKQEKMDYLEFAARVTSPLPDNDPVMTSSYGYIFK